MAEQKCIVAGCIILSGAKVLLLKHKKLGMWLPPGGHVDPGEFPNEAAVREAKEETGLDVKLIRNTDIDFSSSDAAVLESPFAIVQENVKYKTGMHIHFDLVYLATVSGGEQAMNEESTEMRWFTKEELETIETFDNVRAVVTRALLSFGGKKQRE
ncbi:MAG: NUDIX domain-containing protein [Candidatus Micrarchaeota archaeon]|nr:NUDIX domain-containing protein [Candidatus Micrarchaeota archaeon]